MGRKIHGGASESCYLPFPPHRPLTPLTQLKENVLINMMHFIKNQEKSRQKTNKKNPQRLALVKAKTKTRKCLRVTGGFAAPSFTRFLPVLIIPLSVT